MFYRSVKYFKSIILSKTSVVLSLTINFLSSMFFPSNEKEELEYLIDIFLCRGCKKILK